MAGSQRIRGGQVSRRYIDADLPCVSDDRPTKAELAAERDGEKYDEGYSDGKDAGYDEGRADMHAEVMAALWAMRAEMAEDGDAAALETMGPVLAAIAALADDAEVAGE